MTISNTTPPAIQSQVLSLACSAPATGLAARAGAGSAGAAAAEAVEAAIRPPATKVEISARMTLPFAIGSSFFQPMAGRENQGLPAEGSGLSHLGR